jgi:hypothetical protein
MSQKRKIIVQVALTSAACTAAMPSINTKAKMSNLEAMVTKFKSIVVVVHRNHEVSQNGAG